MPRDRLPLDLLLFREEHRVPASAYPSNQQLKQSARDASWGAKKEHLIAIAAAGFHLALFAYNLAFWGFEGMAPDRYWPANPRVKLQAVPKRYGNLAGARKLWYYYQGKIDGAP
jgi:hypothetical protein